eukprot:CAMPEP_0198223184 /NCGR_PEP_ID=MMETSP1445-20131203/91423_1 /TAXON_ID=36898 /ORGANISM="Pyramimonas sp., Strain CCMP2087" /LENGTH=86 /DNA_ID=CAMNT_0043901943 /DNA_START=27 /DNA_END=287 /DNA_ORIENTATION=+
MISQCVAYPILEPGAYTTYRLMGAQMSLVKDLEASRLSDAHSNGLSDTKRCRVESITNELYVDVEANELCCLMFTEPSSSTLTEFS